MEIQPWFPFPIPIPNFGRTLFTNEIISIKVGYKIQIESYDGAIYHTLYHTLQLRYFKLDFFNGEARFFQETTF